LRRIPTNERKDIDENVTVIQKQRVIKDYEVWIYACVSTTHKAQMDSLSVQVPGLTRLAVAHRTWFVADVLLMWHLLRQVG
jgi:resolvase, N-terminal domain protein